MTFSTVELDPGTGGAKPLVDTPAFINGETPPAGAVAQVVEIAGRVSSFAPGYSAPDEDGIATAKFDGEGALQTRGPVLTDEGTYRLNFANTSLAVSIGAVTVAGNIVTGTGFATADAHKNDYFKVAADADTAYAQIASIDSDTQMTLTGTYTGSASGTGNRALMKPVTGTGGSIAVASGQCTVGSGTTIAAQTGLSRLVDYGPLVYRARFSLSQRIANQAWLPGLREDAATPRWFARFRFDGATNTAGSCETGRNPTGAPSASEQEITPFTIPDGLTSAAALDTRIEQLTESVRFYIGGVRVAEHTKVIPHQHDEMTAVAEWVNAGSAPASNTDAVVDYVTGKNHNKLEVGFLSDSEQIVAVQAPAVMRSYTAGAVVIPINTDLIVIDCSQFRSLSILSGAVGTTGVVTGAWSNDGTFTDAITATLFSETGASSTTFTGATALLRTTPVRAKWFRLRMTTATTAAGATRINVACFQADISAGIATQPVSGTVTATLSGSLAAGTNLVGDVGRQYRANATGAASGAHIVSAATTNATIVKASAGRVIGWSLSNTNAAWRYVKLHNQTTTPTAGASVARVIGIPPNGKSEFTVEGGIAFTTGIGLTTVTGSADADTAAVALGDIVGDLYFA